MEPITEPGIYHMPLADYIADPVVGGSLSRSGAKRLLPPSTPAKFRWERDHPEEAKGTPALNLGQAAHSLVLGDGPGVVQLPFENRRTKAAQQAEAEATLAGQVAVTIPEWQQIEAMATALREDRDAANLLEPESGQPERALVHRDESTDVTLRCRLDWLPWQNDDGRIIIPDYKTCRSADDESLSKAIYDHRYHQQAAWAIAAAEALELGESPGFALIFQEKDPPYLVHVVIPDRFALDVGYVENRRAIDLYAQCVAEDHWPGYEGIDIIGLPPWVENRYRDEVIR
jgi:hypothetical protein